MLKYYYKFVVLFKFLLYNIALTRLLLKFNRFLQKNLKTNYIVWAKIKSALKHNSFFLEFVDTINCSPYLSSITFTDKCYHQIKILKKFKRTSKAKREGHPCTK